MMKDETRIEPTDRGWALTLSHEGKEVSGLSIVDQKVRVGKASLKMAGIAGVWTAESHRRKGFASKVMWASIDEMVKRRYDVSILFGIEDFYHRYGYGVCFPNWTCQVDTGTLSAAAGSEYKVRAANKRDLAVIVKLYQKTNVRRPASTIRPANWMPVHQSRYGWRMPRMGEGIERRAGKAIVAENEKSKVLAYAAFDAQDGHCMVIEIGGSDRWAFPALVRRIRQEAARVGAERVRFCVPPDDPFGEYLNRFGSVWFGHHPSNSGSMGRIVSLERTIEKMIPTFEERLGRAELPKDGLSVGTDIGTVTIVRKQGHLAVSALNSSARVEVSQLALTQLITGYRSIQDLLVDGDAKVARRWADVVDALFPKANPYMWWPDRF